MTHKRTVTESKVAGYHVCGTNIGLPCPELGLFIAGKRDWLERKLFEVNKLIKDKRGKRVKGDAGTSTAAATASSLWDAWEQASSQQPQGAPTFVSADIGAITADNGGYYNPYAGMALTYAQLFEGAPFQALAGPPEVTFAPMHRYIVLHRTDGQPSRGDAHQQRRHDRRVLSIGDAVLWVWIPTSSTVGVVCLLRATCIGFQILNSFTSRFELTTRIRYVSLRVDHS